MLGQVQNKLGVRSFSTTTVTMDSVYYKAKAQVLSGCDFYKVGWAGFPGTHTILARDDTQVIILGPKGQPEAWDLDGAYFLEPVISDDFSCEITATQNKIKANYAFSDLLSKYFLSGQRVLVLDTHAQLTCSMVSLALSGREHEIIVPQPDLDEHPVSPVPGSEWLNVSALECIRDYDMQKLCHLWLDYCCTVNGNQTFVRPKVDIELIFFQGMLPKKNGVLACTFSLRGCNLQDTMDELMGLMQSTGSKHGYKMSVHDIIPYQNMLYVSFVSV